MYIMYVHAHGRLGVIFIYVLGKVVYFHTGSLPIELNKRRHVGQRRSFISKDSKKRKLESMYFSISFCLDILPGKLCTRLVMSH